MNSDEILKSRFSDLSRRAFERGYNVFSDFLSMEEVSLLKSDKNIFNYRIFGGYDGAERCVTGFGEDIKDSDFPIKCIEIMPLQQKFADKLTHRDFLGAVMNLGIKRETLGDIIIKDNVGYLFCLSSIADYICDNLCRIKHTSVSCKICDSGIESFNKELQDKDIIVASLRLDAVICAVFHLSRSGAKSLLLQDKIFVNHKITENGSHILKDGDTVSLRGYGKFEVNEVLRNTKKNRLVVKVGVYV